jgi:predicted PurR-regulated permease PerM
MDDPATAPSLVTAATAATADAPAGTPRLRAVLERRAEWIEVLIGLGTVAVLFVVLDFLSRYFADYLRIILIFFFAWLLAFLMLPAVDWLQRHLTRLPRPVAVVLVLIPIIVVAAVVIVRVVASIVESLVSLAAALPGIAANPPSFLDDLQAWFNAQGIAVDVAGTFHTLVNGLLEGMVNMLVGLFGGVVSSVGTFVDAIIVVSLAVFMAIDRDKILRVGLDVTPPEKRDDVILFRSSVATAAAGFIRSQILLGALYGVWALLVSLVFGLPFAAATAALAGLIMMIPIYGPYVSWLPPVLVALLVKPDLAIIVAIVMLVGWFIDENILAPVVRAGALQLHPIVVTFAFLLGGQLAGAIGAIVAIPLAAVVQAFVVKYFEQYRAQRGWPGPDEVTTPPEPDEPVPEAAPAT